MPAWHDLPWTLKGDKGDKGDPAPGGSYLTGQVPAGAATVTITHNLGTRDVVVMVRDTTSYQYVPVANDAPTANTVRLTFATAPTSGQYRYVIFAALGAPVPAPAAPTAHAPTHGTGGSDPVTPNAIGAAPAGHDHSGYAATGHDHSGQYAPAEHTHPVAPVLRGPWVQTNGFYGFELAPIGNGHDTGGRLTVPALGYTWMPLASARHSVRSDVWGSFPSLDLTVDGVFGEVVARGWAHSAARDLGWRPTVVSPVLGVVLSGSSSHTFELWARPGAGGGWIEADANEGDPHITVYALPMEVTP